jgi:hypothetical protein
MAYAASLDANADMTRRRIEQWFIGQLQLAWAHRLHRPIGGLRLRHNCLHGFRCDGIDVSNYSS